MRHIRSDEFDKALSGATGQGRATRWSDLSDDPNAAVVLARRAETLRAAWRPAITDRTRFLEDRCRDRFVLDIGCVAHDVARMSSPGWLHGRLAAASRRCIGVDVLASGVAAMKDQGFEAVVHDLGTGLGPLEHEAPFEVIVAGELIEHVPSLDMLFEIAAQALTSNGELIITTPNPYAPHRVRAGQLGIVWENADHIVYAFPSGIAELAERHGLVLAEAATTADRPPSASVKERLKTMRRQLRGRHFVSVDYSTRGDASIRRVRWSTLGGIPHGLWWPKRRFLGETFVYVIRHAA